MKRLYVILIALVLAVSAGLMATARAAEVLYTQVDLSVEVSGASVAARTTVRASSSIAVQFYGVCVRSSSDDNLDFPKRAATISTVGTTYASDPKSFDPGTYTYFSCLFDGDDWHVVGPAKTLTVAASTTPSPTPTEQPTASPPSASTRDPLRVSKLLTIVEENHSLGQMKSGMPYLYGLAQRYAYADHYTAIRHPSLPNYLAIAGGDTFGVSDDAAPDAHPLSGQSVFGQALAKGLTSGIYAESMPANCTPTGNTDRGYAVKHNPWAYFLDERAACGRTDVPDDRFLTAAQADELPNVAMLIPNKCHDAHDTDLGCDLGTADDWLRSRLPTVLASQDFTSGALAVVVTADEDDNNADNQVLTVVLHASLDGMHRVVSTPLTHYSLSRLYSQVVGAPALRKAAQAPDMAAAFALPVG